MSRLGMRTFLSGGGGMEGRGQCACRQKSKFVRQQHNEGCRRRLQQRQVLPKHMEQPRPAQSAPAAPAPPSRHTPPAPLPAAALAARLHTACRRQWVSAASAAAAALSPTGASERARLSRAEAELPYLNMPPLSPSGQLPLPLPPPSTAMPRPAPPTATTPNLPLHPVQAPAKAPCHH